MMSQMKALEDENRRLKRMFADLSMQAELLKVNRAGFAGGSNS
jgi:putative transposase